MNDENLMEQLPHYRSMYNEAKKIHVYFIPGVDREKNQKIYFYAIASEMLHTDMMQSLKMGVIPHFAVVVDKGTGAPTVEIKAKIKEYYGFDHDFYEKTEQD